MNTRKQVLLMSALLLIALIIVGMYGAWYPYREVAATEHFEEQTNERAAILFARNCRLCHGDVGEGGALGARLPAAPALDRPDLQGFIDSRATLTANATASAPAVTVSNGSVFKVDQTILIDEERMEVKRIDGSTLQVERGIDHTQASAHTAGAQVQILDDATLDEKVDLITNTIACGRVGTAMPAWAQIHGGPLSDEQIRQLMTLITTGRWDLVKEEVDREDRIDARLLQPVSEDTMSLNVSNVSVFTEKEAIRIGDERLRVTGVPATTNENGRSIRIAEARDKSGIISVERGVLGTTPFEHPTDEVMYRFPEAPEPSINQASCGQIARATPEPSPPGLIEPFEGQTVDVIAQNLAFDKRQITVNPGGQVRVRLDNRDPSVQHNIAFYPSATNTTTPLAPGSIGTTFPGVGVDDTAFAIPASGNYFFRCDVHPTTMTGTFTVN